MYKYRIYAVLNDVVEERDFEDCDNAQPFYDDYSEHEIPDALMDHIEHALNRSDEIALLKRELSEAKSLQSKLAEAAEALIEALPESCPWCGVNYLHAETDFWHTDVCLFGKLELAMSKFHRSQSKEQSELAWYATQKRRMK